MILVGLGANLPTIAHGPPAAGLRAALRVMPDCAITVLAVSRFYRSAPVPPSGQPWYVNAVASVGTTLPPRALLKALLAIEAAFGRVRREADGPRVLDLDLLDYDGLCGSWPPAADLPGLDLPHPRLSQRAFVLRPLAELVPAWRHPTSGRSISDLLAALPAEQAIELDESAGEA